jgi:alanyl-tRNA synthetase
MTANELRQKYFDFFISKGHKLIPSASLIPENDPTALFTSAGMHPLVPYLLGEPHPLGKRLVSAQKCLRTDDIDEVGNNVHHTFFQMLGNWSLGDYFKREMIPWSFEFLTDEKWLGIPKEKLAVSVFAGDDDAPFDQESYDLWIGLGIPEKRIAKLPKKNNWWGPVGLTGPCGPDSEMFYWSGVGEAPAIFDPEDKNWVEIWNDVFMEYNKKDDETYEPLKQKNVDTGMGLERTLAVLNGFDDNYKTDLFWPIIEEIQEYTGKNYEENKKEFRIIADHLRAATFLIVDGVEPSNKAQGYVSRRLLRRSAVKMYQLNGGLTPIPGFQGIAAEILRIYDGIYFDQAKTRDLVFKVIDEEMEKFAISLDNGLKELEKLKDDQLNTLNAFNLYQTHGFPFEVAKELIEKRGGKVDNLEFDDIYKKHQELSRTASAGMFKGGLSEQSEITTKYHTATHLLNAALKQVLGDHVSQKGSNITSERLRFDFPNPEKLSEEQVKKVEDLVNEKIKENLPVTMETMSLEEAKKTNANAVFSDRYTDQVKVYSIDSPSTSSGRPFSVEVCGGPHADFTGKLGKFKIIKEESAGAGIRRLYAILE